MKLAPDPRPSTQSAGEGGFSKVVRDTLYASPNPGMTGTGCYLDRGAVRLLAGRRLQTMKLIKLSLGLVTLGLGIASAASSYKITLPSDLSAGTVTLKAGDYKVEVEGGQATFRQGKQEIKVPVSVENSASKFEDTTLESSGTDLQAIDIGGTTTKIVIKTAN
jgi:hypothetical protein